MTDTAKPTPGPVRFTDVTSNWPKKGYQEGGSHEALWSDEVKQPIMVALDKDGYAAHFDFPNPKDQDCIQEAYTVYTETNLTPRQLLAQRDKAQHELEDIWLTVKHLKETIDHLEKRITTTLAKCRKG